MTVLVVVLAAKPRRREINQTLNQKVSPAAFGAIIAVVLVVVAIIGMKVFAKPKSAPPMSADKIAEMKSHSGGGGSAGHAMGGGISSSTGSMGMSGGSMGMSGGSMGMSGGGSR